MVTVITRTEIVLALDLTTQSLIGEEFDNGLYLVYTLTSVKTLPELELTVLYRGFDPDQGAEHYRQIGEVLMKHPQAIVGYWVHPAYTAG